MTNTHDLLVTKLDQLAEQTRAMKELLSAMSRSKLSADLQSVGTGSAFFSRGEKQSANSDLTCGEIDNSPTQLHAAQVLLHQRKSLEKALGGDLVADPVWTMLLDLFVSQARGQRVSVTSLTIGSGVPSTTALRWISVMESRGLIKRMPDPDDRRRIYLELSEEAKKLVSLETEAFANNCEESLPSQQLRKLDVSFQ